MLTGYGPTARQRRFIRHGTPLIRHGTQGGGFAPSAEQMKARARAIDDLLGRDDHEMWLLREFCDPSRLVIWLAGIGPACVAGFRAACA